MVITIFGQTDPQAFLVESMLSQNRQTAGQYHWAVSGWSWRQAIIINKDLHCWVT